MTINLRAHGPFPPTCDLVGDALEERKAGCCPAPSTAEHPVPQQSHRRPRNVDGGVQLAENAFSIPQGSITFIWEKKVKKKAAYF